ncbi:alcohol dehydrogenase catalytic domain-containing protein [Leucobacter luti]|uniref:alcohol dehydrogenase n=1 Tax=Leucobacter luti TaxID=340320 RepID=A0A4Q7TSS5_9MICO|nr:alcohol dehydrogenase catalytic domain-containing protein [Leucobacter luti]MBL3699914.1 alcohol dehydrogenase [Leucobacter luti]RZT62768.1 propanol-preferring alcohol dehydrogenase [Leucobacter luti]
MKAWVLDEVHAPLRLVDVERPSPGPGQVLIKVRASGLCHSDVGYMEGVIPVAIPFPVILGHEASGTIAEIGEGVTGWSVGDAVASAIAPDDAPGVSRDGAYAEYTLVNASNLIRLPEGMDWAQAAAATDAGLTSYTGVVVFGEVTAGDRVGIVGLGGLGMTGAQIAVVQGATVYGVEPREALWETARGHGLAEVFADVSALEGMDLDVVIDFAGFGTTTSGAIRAVKPRGRVVLVGLGRSEWTINSIDLVSRAIELRGATVAGEPAHLQAVIDLVAAGKLTVQAEEIGFEDIEDGLGRLQRGEVNGRLVAMLPE